MRKIFLNSYNKNNPKNQQGFIMATLIAFIPLIFILSTITISLAVQSYQTTFSQELIRQAQLASASAMEYAKEQYEIDQNYMGTPETVLYTTGQYEVRFEVIHKGFTNAINTQQDIQGIGRVYKIGDTTPRYTREIQGKITYTSGNPSSVRFIFIVDNSSSMTTSEWLQSKQTVDASINYVLDNVSSAEVAVVQYGTNHYNQEHKYDVTVPFTNDSTTATTWDRRYGPGSISPSDVQDHLPASLARMRLESVYGPGDELDLANATNIQFILFTDAWGEGFLSPNANACCSSLKRRTFPSEPSFWYQSNGSGFIPLDGLGEYNALKDGSVFADDGYADLTSQFTVLSINSDSVARSVSAGIASPGGTWTGAIDNNPGDPEGNGFLPRRFISTTLAAGPDEIISVIQEIIEEEINF